MTLNLISSRNCLVFFVASVFLLPPQSAYSEAECKSAMPEGYTVNEVAKIREDIRSANNILGITLPSAELSGNPMLLLFIGYASAMNSEDFIALGYLENAEFYAYEEDYCNKKIVRELTSIGRYYVITGIEKKLSGTEYFKNLTFWQMFSPSGMSIRTFKEAECLLFLSDIEAVMSDANYERIYSRRECYGG